ncbi:hypothetical protein VPH35_137978 [Triticum aestivum]
MKLLPAVFLLLLVFLALDDAQARGTPRARWSSMFVFGDDFVDNGNVPNIIGERTSRHGGSGATRRFSNYRMLSDFIARMFGLNEAPPAYELTSDQSCDSSGMTFAFGGAGVFKVAAKKVQTLAAQLDTYMGNVATEILDNVAQLQTLGEGLDRSKDFKRKLTPCCESSYEGGYCGERSSSRKHLYYLCQNPDKRFYWDETHPTHAGWEAVMEALEQPLMEFLN